MKRHTHGGDMHGRDMHMKEGTYTRRGDIHMRKQPYEGTYT